MEDIKSNTTNVNPEELNYDRYDMEQYDEDIKGVIPGHEELHEELEKVIRNQREEGEVENVVELGVGTGLTTERILQIAPKAKVRAIDFSKQMLRGAKQRLKDYDVNFELGDYADADLGENVDIVVSVVGIHHQNEEGIRDLFNRIYNSLSEGGVFILGDLMTYKDKSEAEQADEQHYAHMAEYATDEETLREWEHHHRELNELFTVEDQVDWLSEVGFSDVSMRFQRHNTVLLVAKK